MGTAAFHGTNFLIFNLGTFPFMMMGANCLFLLDSTAVPDDDDDEEEEEEEEDDDCDADGTCGDGGCGGLALSGQCVAALFIAAQLLFPLRHHTYPGPVMWTGLGYHGSWMMKLADNTVRHPHAHPHPVRHMTFTFSTTHNSRPHLRAPCRPWSPSLPVQCPHRLRAASVDWQALVRVLLDGDPSGSRPAPGQHHFDSEPRPPPVVPLHTMMRLTPGQLAPAVLDVGSVEQLAEHVQVRRRTLRSIHSRH
eukprot:COSAG06_NODE_2767_length_6315_cov_73.410071_5_plen_250_part_00